MNTVIDYQTQANDLLAKMNVTFKATFLKHDYHFHNDKEKRDIFRCTFKRVNHDIKSGMYIQFSLKFGQSINQSTGTGKNKPTAYDVLCCIQKYDVGTFENFCSEFGYDNDSRAAEKVYKAVCKEFNNVSRFFTPSEIELLQEIQ